MRLWLDDIRTPPDSSWLWVKSAAAAIAVLKAGQITEVSLDHDLEAAHYEGYFGSGTGQSVADFIAGMAAPPARITIHSLNPIGAARMKASMEDAGLKVLTRPRKL